MMKIFSFLCLFFISIFTSAQIRPIYFYGDQITTDKDKATSYGVYGKLSTENLWTFKRYDLYDNLMQTGSYADENLTVAHGKFTFYLDIETFNNSYLTQYSIKGKTRFISQEGNFKDGLEQGKWMLFYPDGNIFNSQQFVDGKMNGQFITYDRLGKVTLNGNYVDGKRHGEWLLQKGKIRQIWDMDVLISTGNVKKKKTIKGSVIHKSNL